jgi:dihydrofolate reductase
VPWRTRGRWTSRDEFRPPRASCAAQDGGPILVPGSRTLVHFLLDAGLVDELNLQVFPLLLGSGARLYPETVEKRSLGFVSSRPLPNGVQVQTYRASAGGA